MSDKLVRFTFAVAALLVGLLAEQGPPISAASNGAGWCITMATVFLLACGVYGWYRIVKQAINEEPWRQREERLARRSLPERSMPKILS